MKFVKMTAAAFVVVVLASAANAADNKKLIVGKWEAVKVDENTLPKGAIVEFTADGKLAVTIKADKEVMMKGTYTLDGDSFTYKLSIEGKEQSEKITIKKISETELNTANKDGKIVDFKKVK